MPARASGGAMIGFGMATASGAAMALSEFAVQSSLAATVGLGAATAAATFVGSRFGGGFPGYLMDFLVPRHSEMMRRGTLLAVIDDVDGCYQALRFVRRTAENSDAFVAAFRRLPDYEKPIVVNLLARTLLRKWEDDPRTCGLIAILIYRSGKQHLDEELIRQLETRALTAWSDDSTRMALSLQTLAYILRTVGRGDLFELNLMRMMENADWRAFDHREQMRYYATAQGAIAAIASHIEGRDRGLHLHDIGRLFTLAEDSRRAKSIRAPLRVAAAGMANDLDNTSLSGHQRRLTRAKLDQIAA